MAFGRKVLLRLSHGENLTTPAGHWFYPVISETLSLPRLSHRRLR
jgi:hypothetical protein